MKNILTDLYKASVSYRDLYSAAKGTYREEFASFKLTTGERFKWAIIPCTYWEWRGTCN